MPDTPSPAPPPPAVSGGSPHDRHFRTDHLMGDLKGRSVRGGVVTLVSQGVKFVLQLGSTVVLARLLTPEDFGLLAMVTSVAMLVSMFAEAGLSMATVQRPEINHGQVSTLFWVNTAVGALLMLLFAALAPGLSWYYREPRLTDAALLFSTTLLIAGLGVQHQALLRRQMRFRTLALIEVNALVAALTVAIVMAATGWGYWALFGQLVCHSATKTLLMWVRSGWRPGLPVRHSGVRSMLAFGGYLTAAAFFRQIGASMDKILLGRWVGPDPLGNYSKAFQLLMLPVTQMSVPLTAVAIPTMSRLIDDPARHRRAYLRAVSQFVGLMTPLIVVFIVFAEDVVLLVLGPQWGLAVQIFRVFGFATLILPIWNSTGWTMVSQGRVREPMFFHLFDAATKIVTVVVFLPWGVMGVATALTVRQYCALPVLFWMVGRHGPVRQADLYRTLTWPAAIAACVGAALVGLSVVTPGAPPAARVALAAVVAAAAWLTVHLVFPHGRRLLTVYLDSLRELRRRAAGTAA